MKFENICVSNFENAIRGMRNPLQSWKKSDSSFGMGTKDQAAAEYERLYGESAVSIESFITRKCGDVVEWAILGPNDKKLAKTLCDAGPEHRKFMRQINVSVDITAPLFWYKEFDTYRIGVTENSTSTMHKLASTPITLDCFEIGDFNNIPYPIHEQKEELEFPVDKNVIQMVLIPYLEYLRKKYNETKDKTYWKELIRWLPEGWLQTRTVTMNYENVRSMVHQRSAHKLTEWSKDFIEFAMGLPYAELFFE